MKIRNFILYALCGLLVSVTFAYAWKNYNNSKKSLSQCAASQTTSNVRYQTKTDKKYKKLSNNLYPKDFEGTWSGWGDSWAGSGSATQAKESGQQDIVMNGVISLKDRSLGNLTVNGVVDLNNVSLINLVVNGPVTLSEVIISGQTDINGPLDAEKSNFNTIDISASSINLTNCTVKNIKIRTSDPIKQQVVMLCNTTVEGSIEFEQGNGKVILKDAKSVVRGHIVGGTKSNA